jgi:hypothetical protein
MAELSKRATIYFDPAIHRVLKIKAAETSKSISELIDKAVRCELLEDEEDLRAFNERISEPTISYDKLIADLKKDGKI